MKRLHLVGEQLDAVVGGAGAANAALPVFWSDVLKNFSELNF